MKYTTSEGDRAIDCVEGSLTLSPSDGTKGKHRRSRSVDHVSALDSGDLAYLSIQARKLLDQAGFKDAVIFGSNDLDEHIIASLKQQGATINAWGVGTKLVTAYDQPALGGVYKLSAVRQPGGPWLPKLKLSEQAAKITNPGVLQVRRFRSETEFIADAIYDQSRTIPPVFTIVDPLDPTRRKRIDRNSSAEDLLIPIFRNGRLVYELPILSATRDRVQKQLSMLHPGIKRFVNPHQYVAGLELGLHRVKTKLILKLRAALSSPETVAPGSGGPQRRSPGHRRPKGSLKKARL